MGLLDKKKSLLTDEQSHWGDVANRLGADISNYGGSALRGLLKGTVGLPVGLHNLVSDVTGRGSQIDTLSPEWVGKKVEPYLPDGNPKTQIAGEFINPFGAIKAASAAFPLMGLMFAGKNAKTADLFKLRKAEEMLKKGASDRDAYAQTGWTHGFADKKPRFEIDDSNSAIDENVVGAIHSDKGAFQGRMEDALNHPELYDNYDLGNIQASIYASRNPKGSYDRATRTIEVGAPSSGKQKRTALHELNHAVQHQEGHARGGSPREFKTKSIPRNLKDIDFARMVSSNSIRLDLQKNGYSNAAGIHIDLNNPEIRRAAERISPDELAKYDKLDSRLSKYKTADQQYHNLAGEAEARLTEKRMNMTAAERAKSYPPDMFDVPVEDQIVRFDGGKQMMSEGKKKLSLEEKEGFLNSLKKSSPEQYNSLVKSVKKRPVKLNTESIYSQYKNNKEGAKNAWIERNIPRKKIYSPSSSTINYLKSKGFKETDQSYHDYDGGKSLSEYFSNGEDFVRVSDHAPVNSRSNIPNNFYPDSHKSEKDAFKAIDKIVSNKKPRGLLGK